MGFEANHVVDNGPSSAHPPLLGYSVPPIVGRCGVLPRAYLTLMRRDTHYRTDEKLQFSYRRSRPTNPLPDFASFSSSGLGSREHSPSC